MVENEKKYDINVDFGVMRDRTSRMAKIRQDLEGRVDSVITSISSQRFSGFEDWIAAILQQREHRITMCSAFLSCMHV